MCDLIEEKKPKPGIFSVMDDACATAHADPVEADRSLMQRLGGACSSHAHYKDLGQAGFMIKHYAGDVTYEASGMTDKNKDQLVCKSCLKNYSGFIIISKIIRCLT